MWWSSWSPIIPPTQEDLADSAESPNLGLGEHVIQSSTQGKSCWEYLKELRVGGWLWSSPHPIVSPVTSHQPFHSLCFFLQLQSYLSTPLTKPEMVLILYLGSHFYGLNLNLLLTYLHWVSVPQASCPSWIPPDPRAASHCCVLLRKPLLLCALMFRWCTALGTLTLAFSEAWCDPRLGTVDGEDLI